MTALLTSLFGRLPIGWLQLTHNRTRFAAALAGVAFANILIFMQLGFLGALIESIKLPYRLMDGQILVQASDANTLQDGSPLPRQRMYQALAVPGVADVTPLYYAKLDWKQPDGTIRTLDVFGVDPNASVFRSDALLAARDQLKLADVGLLDRRTRNIPKDLIPAIEAATPYTFEANGRTLTVVGTFEIGGGFSADGYLVVSDQTFLRLFKQRVAGAPNHVLVRVAPGADVETVAAALRASLPASDTNVSTIEQAQDKDQSFQTTQKPIGIIFGFGVVIGGLVGIIIVYQVLSTDVADHLKEYATFKAIGYPQSFFLGIVFEEALVLALFGFVPGVLIGLGLYRVVAVVTGLPITMSLTRPVLVLIATIAMCTISGAIATRRLANADPADLF
jgi:putative ABC transport system permease protein